MTGISNMRQIRVKSAVEQLIDCLTQAIIDGEYKAGEQIPTEPELAAAFGVGRNTVREAVKTLEAYGILEVRRPKGTFVCSEFKSTGINPMIYGLILQKENSYEELIGLRKIVENGILLLLAEKKLGDSEKDLQLQILKYFEAAVAEKNIPKIIQEDINFHNALAEMTENKLVVLVNDMITKLTYASRVKTIEMILEQKEEQYLIDTHYSLMNTLENKNIEDLYKAIQNSYFYWKDVYKENN